MPTSQRYHRARLSFACPNCVASVRTNLGAVPASVGFALEIKLPAPTVESITITCKTCGARFMWHRDMNEPRWEQVGVAGGG